MFLQRGSRALRSQWGASKAVGRVAMGKTPQSGVPRWFSESRRLCAIKPVLLADIGEGVYPLFRLIFVVLFFSPNLLLLHHSGLQDAC